MPKRCLAVLAAAAIVALTLAACGGGDEAEGTTSEGTEAAATSVTTEEPDTEPSGEGDPQAGEAVFASAGCGGCHTLAAVNSTGSVGPDLDELQPDYDEVVEQVTNGGGAMPAFGETLSEQQIRDVAAFVVQSTSQSGDGGSGSEDNGSGGGYG